MKSSNILICQVLVLIVFFTSSSHEQQQRDFLSPGQSINATTTLKSTGETFSLGFFNPGKSNRWYLGIWFDKIPERSVVWVANRETPVNAATAVLTLTVTGSLVIRDGSKVVWSADTIAGSNMSSSSMVARLLDSGNFVLTDNSSTTAGTAYGWQSFDYPTDTMVEGMRIGVDLRTGRSINLTSWRSEDDPAPGKYTVAIDVRGVPQLNLYHESNPLWRVGPWTGKYWNGYPVSPQFTTFIALNHVSTEDEIYFSYQLTINGYLTSMVVNQTTGKVDMRLWQESSPSVSVYSLPQDTCDNYKECGANSICSLSNQTACSCMEGFTETNSGSNNDYCLRKVQLDCIGKTDEFQKISDVKLPDTEKATVTENVVGLDQCKAACLANCSCTAYSSADFNGLGCLMWVGDLQDLRTQSAQSQDFYIRLGTVDSDEKKFWKKPAGIAVAVVISLVGGTLLLGFVSCLCWRRRKNTDAGGEEGEDFDLPIFDFATISKATDNFSDENKLGQGGFGPVYKGTMESGQVVAIKRLSNHSIQGIAEFKNEVHLIAKLQHRNLVRLLGCCVEGKERMLVYEYMPNKSLDKFLFDKQKSESIDWPKRCEIVVGIARGLLYLHQDSRLTIIHRDLKAANILLDNEMNPKVSDFGTAKIFLGTESEHTNTSKAIGTFGYMSPEYALDGIFSMKSDVFSFGIILLEIISGIKNGSIFESDTKQNLIGHAWALWEKGCPLDLIDPSILESCSESELLKYIKIGLLCVQENPEDRPLISSVLSMLTSDAGNLKLREPNKPNFINVKARASDVVGSSLGNLDSSSSVNGLTITISDDR